MKAAVQPLPSTHSFPACPYGTRMDLMQPVLVLNEHILQGQHSLSYMSPALDTKLWTKSQRTQSQIPLQGAQVQSNWASVLFSSLA